MTSTRARTERSAHSGVTGRPAAIRRSLSEVDTFGETLLVAAACVIHGVAAELIIVRRTHASRARV